MGVNKRQNSCTADTAHAKGTVGQGTQLVSHPAVAQTGRRVLPQSLQRWAQGPRSPGGTPRPRAPAAARGGRAKSPHTCWPAAARGGPGEGWPGRPWGLRRWFCGASLLPPGLQEEFLPCTGGQWRHSTWGCMHSPAAAGECPSGRPLGHGWLVEATWYLLAIGRTRGAQVMSTL